MRRIYWHPFIWIPLSLTAFVSVASYGLRASSYFEQTFRQRLEQVSERREIDVKFKTLEPAGLTGIELNGVTGTANFNDRQLSIHFDSLRLYLGYNPFESLNKIALTKIVPSTGSVDISPRKNKADTAAPSELENQDSSSGEGQKAMDPGSNPGLLAAVDFGVADDLEAVFTDTIVEWESRLGRIRPLFISRLIVTRQDFGLSGYGRLPDKTAFSIRSTSKRPTTYLIKTHGRMRLDKWFPVMERQLARQMFSAAAGVISLRSNVLGDLDAEAFFEHVPLEVEPFDLELCPGCETPSVRSRRLHIHSRTEQTRIGRVSMSLGDALSMKLDRVSLPFLPAGTIIEETSLRYLPTNRKGTLDVVLSQTESFDWSGQFTPWVEHEPLCSTSPRLPGSSQPLAEETLEIALEVAPPDWDIQGVIRSNRFKLGGFWERIGLGSYLRYGRISGTQSFTYRWQNGELDGDMQLETRDIEFRLPLVSKHWLKLEHATWKNNYAVDVSGGKATLQNGVVAVSRNDFLNYDLSFRWRGGSPRLEARAQTGWLNPNSLKRSLPGSISSVTEQTAFDGLFGLKANIFVDAGEPEKTVLDVQPFGDVDTIARRSSSEIWSLASDGPPSFEISAAHVDWIDPSAWTPVENIPAKGIDTLIAGEDTKFFDHHGFNWAGLRRAVVANLKERELQRGGSTLTQQLAKNLFLTSERTLTRKLKEVYYTWRLEEWLSKERILELYLNIVQFGPGVVGIEAAGEYYFGESLEQMGWLEYILLTSILPAPNYFGQILKKDELSPSRVTKAEHILKNLHFENEITTDMYHRLIDRVWKMREQDQGKQMGHSTVRTP